MKVMLDKIYIFRMTHIENIPHILQYGITHCDSVNANPNFRSIGDSSLISTRNDFRLKSGDLLGNYIPFYFGCRMPMLYVVQNGFNSVKLTPAENIVYCVSSVAKIIRQKQKFVFTDGHAVDAFSSQYSEKDINSISELLDWNAINAKYWKDENDLDLKRRKEAEFLVLGDISTDAIEGYYVYNELAKHKLVEFGVSENQIRVKPNYYF